MNEMGKLELQGKHLVLLQEGAARNVGLCCVTPGPSAPTPGTPRHQHSAGRAPQHRGEQPVPCVRAGSIPLAPPRELLQAPGSIPSRRRSILRIPRSSLARQGRWQEAAGGTLPQSGSTRGKHPESLRVSLTVIQLGLCQEEVAAWRNASTF